MLHINRKAFFDGIRHQPFKGKLTVKQVEGITVILDAYEASKGDNAADLAYILATPAIETGWRYQPIKEIGGHRYFMTMYDITGARPEKAKELGNIHPGDGAKFPGMGYVQSTGRTNARRMGKLAKEVLNEDVNFEETPERLMEPKFAALALVVGLQRGIFTGKKLADYLRSTPPDFKGARRTVNGQDRVLEIAGIAKQFYADILAAT